MGFEIVFCVLKSGDFFLGPIFSEVKKSRNIVTIARNLLPNVTMFTYANRSEKICSFILYQRTNDPVNAHLISWPSKAQNIQNLETIWLRNDLDLLYSHNFINSISCLHLPTFRSLAAIVSEKSTVFTFSHRKS